MSRILGLDPGLQVTGYGLVERDARGTLAVLEAGVIRSADERTTTDMAPRVRVLYDSLSEILDQWKPAILVVEQLYAHYEHPRTAILMAHARGCFLLAAAQRGIETVSYAPTRVKKTITGHGRATKDQMQHAIMRELSLAQLPQPHDVSDALALALCHHYLAGTTIVGGGVRSASFTGVNRDALFGTDQDGEDQ